MIIDLTENRPKSADSAPAKQACATVYLLRCTYLTVWNTESCELKYMNILFLYRKRLDKF